MSCQIPGWVAGLAVVAAVAPLAGQTFRADVDLVRLPVVVLRRDGTPVAGLHREDFVVREAGLVQQIVSFAEGAPGPAVPLHLALMFDTSRSMESHRMPAARMAVDLVDTLAEAVDVTLIEFDATVRVSRYEPPSYGRLFARLRQSDLGERTALFDAFGRYLAMVHERPGQHVLIVCTDGADSSFSLGLPAVVDLLRRGDVIVYTIGYLDDASGTTLARQQAVLSSVARETGGEAFFPSRPADTDRIAARIRAEIDGRYTLGYMRTGAPAPETFRRVEVTLARPDLRDLRVRTRSGYRLTP